MDVVCTKRKFRSKRQAERALLDCKIQALRDERRQETRVYECPICHYWHLTSRESV